MPKDSLDFEILKILCEFDGEKYIQKYGDEYIKSLGKVFQLNNINDKPYTIDDIKKQPLISDFKFLGVADYRYICKLKVRPLTLLTDGTRKNEKIFAEDFVGDEEKRIFKKA